MQPLQGWGFAYNSYSTIMYPLRGWLFQICRSCTIVEIKKCASFMKPCRGCINNNGFKQAGIEKDEI